MRLEFHPEAEGEFIEAVSYYENRVPGLGERFDAALQIAVGLLLEYPEIGHLIDAGLRRLVLDRFPYYLIYAIASDVIYIVAVAHESRRPGYWQARGR